MGLGQVLSMTPESWFAKSKKTSFAVNEKDAFRIERTPHTLSGLDKEAKKVFSIDFLNDHAVRLFGDFHSREGCHVVIDESGVEFRPRPIFQQHGPKRRVGGSRPTAAKAVAQTEPRRAHHPARGSCAAEGGRRFRATATSAADVGAAMTEAAQAFLASLQPDELAKATMKFDDPARLDWTNIPKKQRKGLPIRDMTPEQKTLCHNLLRAALSPSGYDKAVKIMALENNLREGEKNLNTGWARDPEHYYLTIFGQPATRAPGAGVSRDIISRSTSSSATERWSAKRPASGAPIRQRCTSTCRVGQRREPARWRAKSNWRSISSAS